MKSTQLTLLLMGALAVMAGIVIAPALPAIHAHFAAEPGADFRVRLLLTAPALAIAVMAPLAGWFLDRYSKQRILMLAVVGFVAFGSAGMFLDDLESLLVSRAGLGIAIAFMMTGVASLAGDLFQPPVRAAFMGRQVSANSLLGPVFLLCGGLLADTGWRAIFLVYFAAVPMLAMLWYFVPRHAPVATAANIEAPASSSVVPWRTVGALYVLAVVNMAFFYLIPTQSPFLIATLYDGSAAMSGAAIGASALGAFPFALTYGRLRKRLSAGQIFTIGFAVSGLGYLLQSAAGSIPEILLAMAVSGSGFGLIMPNLTTTLLAASPPPLRGRLAGGLTTSIFLGQFLSPVFSQPLVSLYGIRTAFLFAGVTLVLASVAIWLISQRVRTGRAAAQLVQLQPEEGS